MFQKLFSGILKAEYKVCMYLYIYVST